MSYENLIEEMISVQSTVLGTQAVELAKSVRGLQVDDDGSVLDVTDDPVTVVDDLVAAYANSLGDAARVKLTEVAQEYDDLDLPASLQ